MTSQASTSLTAPILFQGHFKKPSTLLGVTQAAVQNLLLNKYLCIHTHIHLRTSEYNASPFLCLLCFCSTSCTQTRLVKNTAV